MIKNYFKIAWRNLVKHKAYSIINIAGLTTGIAACLLIFLVVRYEFSYDKFQKNYARTYRIVTSGTNRDGSTVYNPGTPTPAADAIRTDFPQFEKVTAVTASYGSQVIVLGNDPNATPSSSKKFIEETGVIFTQPDYFGIFNATWLQGDTASLSEPGNAVLDKQTASKYFGDWKNANGKYIKLDNTILLKITGVIEDAPLNSDFPIKLFIAYETVKRYADKYGYSKDWGSLGSNSQLYVLLPANVNAAGIQSQMKAFIKKHDGAESRREFVMQPLQDMHFNFRYQTLGDHVSSKTILWTLSLIGILIIVMASINFINLSTAQAVGRSREVGIRKVLGSTRSQLIGQVMGETFLLVLFSILLSIVFAKLALPYLSHVANVPASISLLTAGSFVFLIVTLVTVTVLSGTYPAMVVSGFTPVLALKSKINAASIGGISLRRILVVTQFSISQVLIIGTIVAVSQMNYVRDADLGFNKEAVFVVPAYSDSALMARMKPMKETLLKNPDVISVSIANDVPSSDNNWATNFYFDNSGKDIDFPSFLKYADEDYFKTFGLQFAAGRGFHASDTMRELVVNETMMQKLGITDPQKMIGKTIRMGGNGTWLPIVGVVKDFKTNSLREDIKPLTISESQARYYTTGIKIRTTNIARTTAQIQKIWESTYPEYAYESHFMDDSINRFYRQEIQLSLLYKIFAGIAIFISCLGLYGLVSYMAVQKTKEVGIRKVLGASVSNIVVMFSKEFTLLITIAFVIAGPVAWYLMNSWLQNFVYRIHIGASVFFLAIVASLFIAWITVGYRAVKAALANPVKSLRSE
ncbi:MAG: ABC transporter permease [Chitinophagaceae bacterium]